MKEKELNQKEIPAFIVFAGILVLLGLCAYKDFKRKKSTISMVVAIEDKKSPQAVQERQQDKSNVFEWVSVFIFVLLIFWMLCFDKDNTVVDVLERFGRALEVLGAIYIGSGVYYRKPAEDSLKTLEQLKQHVVSSYASTSRHCVWGLFFFCIGAALPFAGKLLWVKSLG